MSDTNSHPNVYTIHRLRDGGYVVVAGSDDYGHRSPAMATQDLEQAFDYVRARIASPITEPKG